MKLILFVHLICVAAWLACILVEAVLEHSIDKPPDMRIFISKIHWSTDKFIEIPAFMGVLAASRAAWRRSAICRPWARSRFAGFPRAQVSRRPCPPGSVPAEVG